MEVALGKQIVGSTGEIHLGIVEPPVQLVTAAICPSHIRFSVTNESQDGSPPTMYFT